MLVPLTREKFEQIIPLIATGPQYIHAWGKISDFLRRVLISVIGLIVSWIMTGVFGEGSRGLALIIASIFSLYWFWMPIYIASRRNSACRKFPYSGFWRGRVLDVYVTEELIGEEETVNKQGQLVIIENRERRINIEVGDRTGFRQQLQAPLKRIHKAIKPGQVAELIVLSRDPDLSRIAQVTDAYIPSQNLWIGEYPYLQRKLFDQVSRELRENSNYNRDYEQDYPPRRNYKRLR